MADHASLFDDKLIAFFSALWGEGYISPGGPEEVARVLDGLDLAGKTVLDIGSGAGGVTLTLVREHGAARVTGIDIGASECAAARKLAARAGLAAQIEIVQVEPGPWPFAAGAFDLVFSKDSIIHIADKDWLAREAFRVLRPGGWFAASDWLISHDGEPSPAMQHYIALEDLGFAMASPTRYRQALQDAGFTDIAFVNRNAWYREQARAELARLTGPGRKTFEEILGPDAVAAQIATWSAMVPMVDSGEHCPHHFRARKPERDQAGAVAQ